MAEQFFRIGCRVQRARPSGRGFIADQSAIAPVRRGPAPPVEDGRMDLIDALRSTGSVREFTDEPVDDAVLARILDTARFAPSGANAQAWRLVVVRIRRSGPVCAICIDSRGSSIWPSPPPGCGRGHRSTTPPPRRPPWPPGPGRPSRPRPADWLPTSMRFRCCSRCSPTCRSWPPSTGTSTATHWPVAPRSTLRLEHPARRPGRRDRRRADHDADQGRRRGQAAARRRGPLVLAAVIALGHPVRQVTRLTRQPVASFATIDRVDGAPFRTVKSD